MFQINISRLMLSFETKKILYPKKKYFLHFYKLSVIDIATLSQALYFLSINKITITR